MNVILTPEQEAMIRAEIETGRFGTVQEVVGEALLALRARRESAEDGKVTESQRAAVREMLKFAQERSVKLEGISIRDLINEGRRL